MSIMLKENQKKETSICHKVIIIADDFTGSNDTGVQLKNYGLSTVTILDKNYLNDVKEYDAVVIDSETRSKTPVEAYKEMLSIAESIKSFSGRSIIYKKIDSTLRGNIGIELQALIKVLEPEIVVFAPAYPKNNRVTVHGIQHVNHIPIDRTELSHDPKNPVSTADIRELLRRESKKEFYHMDIDKIHNGKISEIMKGNNTRYFCFDAENDEDLKKIVADVLKLDKNVLWVGSAGLADALMSYLAVTLVKYKPVFAVVGSINSISAAQAKKALTDGNVAGVIIDVEKAILNPDKEKKDILQKILKNIKNGFDVILASAIESQQIITASSLGKSMDMPLNEISCRISDFIGDIVSEVLSNNRVSGAFLTGGDTAINVIKKLSAKGSVIVEEIEPGIPLIRLFDGPCTGLNTVTKAGAFGNEDTILNAIRYLRKLR